MEVCSRQFYQAQNVMSVSLHFCCCHTRDLFPSSWDVLFSRPGASRLTTLNVAGACLPEVRGSIALTGRKSIIMKSKVQGRFVSLFVVVSFAALVWSVRSAAQPAPGPAWLHTRMPSPGNVQSASSGLRTNNSAFQVTSARPPRVAQTLVEVGPNSRSWTVSDETSRFSSGGGPARSGAGHRVVQLTSGLNYWNGTTWVPSEPFFELSPQGDAFVANKVQTKARLAGDINVPGAVTLVTPDGLRVSSTPLCIALYNSADGSFAVIGSITNCQPILIESNVVTYPDAFHGSGVCADLRYTTERGSFEQDTIITGRIDPTQYGFPTNTTLVQIWTELYQAPVPDRIRRPIYIEQTPAVRQRMVSPDLIDEELRFGELAISKGRAFSALNDAPQNPGAVVAKEFKTINGRTFLVESISFLAIWEAMAGLPDCGGTNGTPRLGLRKSRADAYASLPHPGDPARAIRTALRPTSEKLAKAITSKRPGVLVDYLAVIGPGHTTPALFKGDTTYFVAGPVYCGDTTIEGGAVFKYPFWNTNAFVQIAGTLTCATSEYSPVTCTAGDDESIGDSVGGGVIWPDWSGYVAPGAYYANPALRFMYSANLSNFRFLYCREGVETQGDDSSNSSYVINHSQFLKCLLGLRLLGGCNGCEGGCDDGGGGCCGTFLSVNNVLMAQVATPLSMSLFFPADCIVSQCTIDSGVIPNTAPAWLIDDSYNGPDVSVTFYNSILDEFSAVNSGNQNNGIDVAVYASYNGFVNNATGFVPFGDHPVAPGGQQFQPVASGSYYLDPASQFRGAGYVGFVGSGLLNDLKSRTTDAPIREPAYLEVTPTLPLQLTPQAHRYVSGAPDLGYYYPVLDYTVGTVFIEATSVTIAPGTAVGVRYEQTPPEPVPPWLYGFPGPANCGFLVWENSSLVSHGTPNSHNVMTAVRLVQEGPFDSASFNVALVGDFEGEPFIDMPPQLSFRFCDFSFAANDCDFAVGALTEVPFRFPGSANSTVYWSVRDCTTRGGQCLVTPPYSPDYFFGAGAISWVNSVFDRVSIILVPTYYFEDGAINVDLQFQAYNNLVHGGTMLFGSNPSSAGDWVIRDNLFDTVTNWQDLDYNPNNPTGPPPPLDHDYNSYWQTDEFGWKPFGTPHDQIVLNATPPYQSGPFGNYYLPPGTLNVDSTRTTAQATLSKYTTRYDQVADGANVTIGLHYVATASGASMVPKSSGGDGVPDYVADADGDGITDSTEAAPLATGETPMTKAINDVFAVQHTGLAQDDHPISVLTNDTDSLGLPLTIVYPSSQINTPHGTVRPAPDFKSLIYTPNSTFTGPGPDIFTYAVVNDFNQESSASVSVYVNATGGTPPLTPPVAVNHTVTLDGYLDPVTGIDLLAGCTGTGLSVYSYGTPQYGTFQQTGTTYTYTPNSGGAGPDTFNYVIVDSNGMKAVGWVTVLWPPTGSHIPVAVSYSTTAVENQQMALPLVAYDPDGHSLSYVFPPSWPNSQHGILSGTPPNLTYTPATGFIGLDSFSFSVVDGSVSSPPAEIVIKVQLVNNPPVAQSVSVQGVLERPLPITLPAYDLDGDFLTYTILPADPAHPTRTGNGTLSGNPPNVVYTPDAGFEGYDSFNFQVSDGKATSPFATVYITVTKEQIITLSSSENNFTFRGDITYYVNCPVTLTGTTTIEGGTVVKFAWNRNPPSPAAKLSFNGPINLLTSLYRPAIFTAEDDNTVGTILPTSDPWGPFGYYADVALELPNTGGTDLRYIRIAYANTAVRYLGENTSLVTNNLYHAQILNCAQGIWADGNADLNMNHQINVGNCLLENISLVFTGSVWTAKAEHLTVDWCQNFAPDPTAMTFSLHVTNSIFSNLGYLQLNASSPMRVDGDYNGFYASPEFGATQLFEDPSSPFASASGANWAANAQGAYYLGSQSHFISAGTSQITPGLAVDLSSMTVFVPEFIGDDLTSSQVLTPAVPREAIAVPSLGWHYAAVDYVINGTTINNCTLNVDQGTVFAFTTPYYEWGLRLNPGGRLSVNGVPTNRVVFARLEAVQENPAGWTAGALLSLKGVFLPSGTMVTPLPEARFHYADFPTLAGSANTFDALTGDQTVDCIQTVELDACHLQGGSVAYEAGGPVGRTLNVHNTIFERCTIAVQDRWNNHTDSQESLIAANNLFYACDMWLTPAPGANQWSFIDNIFDGTSFHGSGPCHGTGPVNLDSNNAYVGMSGAALTPVTSSIGDQTLASLAYVTGPLGRFYLPTGSSLLGNGSRSVGDAGLWHFTSLSGLPSTKEGNNLSGLVNIGPGYLALDVNGNPFDSNVGGPDGIPDFIADRNGNGIEESDEIPWTSANSGSLSILSPINNSTISGVVRIRFNLGPDASTVTSLTPYVDGQLLPNSLSLVNPASSIAEMEIDTKYLANETPHTLFLACQRGQFVDDSSPVINLQVLNAIRYPNWDGIAEVGLNLNLDITSADGNYSLSFFNSSYPKSYNPSPSYVYQGTTPDGNISYSQTLQTLGMGDGTVDPSIFIVLNAAAASSPSQFPAQTPAMKQYWRFPVEGRWTVAYTDDYVDFNAVDAPNGPDLDPLVNFGGPRWCHDMQIGTPYGGIGWAGCGTFQDGESPTLAVTAQQNNLGPWRGSQTMPIRVNVYGRAIDGFPFGFACLNDFSLLKDIFSGYPVVNAYLAGHGYNNLFMGANRISYERWIKRRFRFVFLDGCETVPLLKTWGANDDEIKSATPLDIDYYVNSDPNKKKKLRPGAFLAWISESQICYPMNTYIQDPTTHLPCCWRRYEALCNWNAQLIAYWVNIGWPLKASIDKANQIGASVPGSPYPPWPGTTPGWQFTRKMPTPQGEQPVTFDPSTCLKLAGYGNLRFSGPGSYNLSEDWPP